MSNRNDSRQHGLHRAPRMRPKKSGAKRLNKAKNRIEQQKNQSALAEAITKSEK